MNFCILHWCLWRSYVAQMMKTAPKSIIFMNLTPRSVVSLKKPMNWQKTLNICVLHLYWWRFYLSQAAHLYIVKVLQSLLLYKYPHWKLGKQDIVVAYFFHIFYPKIVHIYECYMVFECHLYLIITNVLKHKKNLFTEHLVGSKENPGLGLRGKVYG